jgi:hypothetical protein
MSHASAYIVELYSLTTKQLSGTRLGFDRKRAMELAVISSRAKLSA